MNRDMDSQNGTATLRDRQRIATRNLIIDAFLELAHAENAVSISIPAVAHRAGVSVRTVYRHFPTKSDLQTAAAFHYSNRTRNEMATLGQDDADLESYLKQLWVGFAAEIPAVIAEHSTPAGRALRSTRLSVTREAARSLLPDAVDDETVDLIIALSSSSMFLELVDRMDHAPDRAAELVTRLIARIIADATEKEIAP